MDLRLERHAAELRPCIDERPIVRNSHGFGATLPVLRRWWGWVKLCLVVCLCLEPGIAATVGRNWEEVGEGVRRQVWGWGGWEQWWEG